MGSTAGRVPKAMLHPAQPHWQCPLPAPTLQPTAQTPCTLSQVLQCPLLQKAVFPPKCNHLNNCLLSNEGWAISLICQIIMGQALGQVLVSCCSLWTNNLPLSNVTTSASPAEGSARFNSHCLCQRVFSLSPIYNNYQYVKVA